MNKDGSCPDCGHTPQIGEWPYPCAGRDHILYVRLAIFGSGRTPDYAPPMPFNPITEPVVTRDWINPDGTVRPQSPGETPKEHVTYI